MTIIERITTSWKNTKSMPFVLRMLNQGAMVATPILLLFLVFPFTEWEVNGRLVPYAELWSSGQGPAISVPLTFACVGAWGLAARKSAARWFLVSAPVTPQIVLAIFPWARAEPIDPATIASAFLTAAVFYFACFICGQFVNICPVMVSAAQPSIRADLRDEAAHRW